MSRKILLKFVLGIWCTICLLFGSSVLTVSIGQVSDGTNSALSKDIAALDYEFWLSIKNESNPAYFDEYLKVFPEGIYAGLVRTRLNDAGDYAAVVSEREQYRAESAALAEKNLTLEQQLADLVSLKALLEQRIESLGDEKVALQGERSALTERNAGLNRKLSALTQFQVQLESQVNNLAAALVKLEEDKARLFEENRSTTAWLATLLELKQSLEDNELALKAQLSKLQAGQIEVKAERDLLLAELEEINKSHAAILETIDKPKQEIIEESLALRARLKDMEVESTELQASRLALEREVTTLIEHRLTLEQEKIGLGQQIAILSQEQVVAAEEMQKLLEELTDSKERYRLTKTELDYLAAEHADEALAFKNEREILKEELKALDILKAKFENDYNRLVRPARNRVGRYVVEIRYWKENGLFHYSLLEREQGNETKMSKSELHERLSKLKAAHPNNLYTHVIFPNGTDISHADAYWFENNITTRYDYYHSN